MNRTSLALLLIGMVCVFPASAQHAELTPAHFTGGADSASVERLHILVSKFKAECDWFNSLRRNRPTDPVLMEAQEHRIRPQATEIHRLLNKLDRSSKWHAETRSKHPPPTRLDLDGTYRFIYWLYTQDTLHCPMPSMYTGDISKPHEISDFLSGRSTSLKGIDSWGYRGY